MNKKEIILVPITHWDREWYFTNQTSLILLCRMKNDIISSSKKFHFNLDGQASLAEELINGNQKEISTFLTKNKISAGPLYVQQDTFNVMIGTTLSNIEMGKKVLENNIPKTVYMPDTFGFNEQLPQIFVKNGFENFVSWRGLKVDEKYKSNFYFWKGIDGTKINASTMSEGYYCMGQHFPYNENTSYDFVKKLYEYIKRMEKKDPRNIYWVPLGGDQAPYIKNTPKAVKIFNNKYREYKLVIGTLDQYFDSIKRKKKENIITSRMDYSGTSKIHRTIHSNRYDIKKLFRKIEIKLYYELEPLELIYQKMGGKLLEHSIKDKHIYKKLLKSSAHDSLGGCNSDKTNLQIYVRNQKVLEFVNSYIDYIKRDIKENLNLSRNNYIVFNLSPFKKDITFLDKISTDNEKKIFSQSGEIIEYEQEDISWTKKHGKVFNHLISVNVKNLKPLSYKIIKLSEGNIKSTSKIKLNLKFKIEKDEGDEYDFSYTKKDSSKYIYGLVHKKTVGIGNHKISHYFNKELNANIYAFKNSHGIQLKIFINNKFSNKRISLVFNREGKVKLSRHLALVEQHMDNIKNWKIVGYKDEPINFFTNDGIIVNGKNNILTRGTNEVFIAKNEIELTLYRSIGMLGKPNLMTRPGAASGLSQKYKTPDGQIKRLLEFDLAFSKVNSIKALNNWNFSGIGQFSSNVNPILNKVEKFIWNKCKLKSYSSNFKSIDMSTKLVGRFRIKTNKWDFIFTDQKNKNPYKIFHKIQSY